MPVPPVPKPPPGATAGVRPSWSLDAHGLPAAQPTIPGPAVGSIRRLIVLSIALGVATLVSTRILNQCIEAAAEHRDPAQAGRPVRDERRAGGGAGHRRRPAGGEHPRRRVRAAHHGGPRGPAGPGRPPAVLLGVELAKHQLPKGDDPFEVLNGENPYHARFSKIELTRGAVLRLVLDRSSAVVLSRDVYDRWVATRANADETLKVRYGGRKPEEFTRVAVVDFDKGSPLATLGTDLIGMEIDRAARFLRPDTPRVTRIDLMLAPDADPATAHRPRRRRGGRGSRRHPHVRRAGERHPERGRRDSDRVHHVLARRDGGRPVPRLQRAVRHRGRAAARHRHPPVHRHHPAADGPGVPVAAVVLGLSARPSGCRSASAWPSSPSTCSATN